MCVWVCVGAVFQMCWFRVCVCVVDFWTAGPPSLNRPPLDCPLLERQNCHLLLSLSPQISFFLSLVVSRGIVALDRSHGPTFRVPKVIVCVTQPPKWNLDRVETWRKLRKSTWQHKISFLGCAKDIGVA